MLACKDCRYHSHRWPHRFCKHPLASRANESVIHGIYHTPRTCQEARGDEGPCGSEAKLWEPSLLYKVKQFAKSVIFG